MIIAELNEDSFGLAKGTRLEVVRSVKYMGITPCIECEMEGGDKFPSGKRRELIAPEFLTLTA